MSNQTLSYGIKDLIQPFLKDLMDNKSFKVRKNLNWEKVLFLNKNLDFIADIKATRSLFEIPKLIPKEDYGLIRKMDIEFEDSNWLSGQSTKYIESFESKVKEILLKYDLSSNFNDWVEWFILYGKPKFSPTYYVEAFLDVIDKPNEVEKLELTTGEKKLFGTLLKLILKFDQNKRKSTKDRIVKDFSSTLNLSKNTKRRSRVLNSALKVYSKPATKDFDTQRENMGLNSEQKYTYRKYVFDNFQIDIENDEEFEKVLNQKADKLRKQKQRLLKRMFPASKK